MVDKPPAGTRYTVDVVAMARPPSRPPGTAGSQFFIITNGEPLKGPPLYAVLGRVTGGKDVVQKIGKLGDVATELPTKRVVIKHALLHQS